MKPLELFEHRRGADPGHALEQGHDLGAPDLLEGIDPGPILPRRALAWQQGSCLDPPRRALAEPRPGRRGCLRVPCLA